MSADIGRNPKDYLAEKIASKTISKADGAIILRYIERTATESGISETTAASNCRYASQLVESLPNIPKWDYDKVIGYVSKVRWECRPKIRREYKPNTVRKHLFILKHFVLWLSKEKIITPIAREQLDGIKPPAADRLTKTADDMITDDEFQKILSATKTSRDRAILAVLFESALRPNELLTMTWGDIKTDEKGAIINTAGKTGKPRYVRLIRSAEFLKIWKNDYPETIRGDSPVFVNLDKKPYHSMTLGSLRKIILKSTGELNGKKINPYLFRHSRITEMLAKGIPESVIKLQAWGSLSSPMLATYGHLSNDQQDDFLMAAEGVTPNIKVKTDSVLKPSLCPACGASNSAGLEYCGVCGSILDPVKYQEKLDAGNDAQKEIAELRERLATIEAMQNLSVARPDGGAMGIVAAAGIDIQAVVREEINKILSQQQAATTQ